MNLLKSLKSVVLASALALPATTTVSFAQQQSYDCGYDWAGQAHCGMQKMPNSNDSNPRPNWR